MSTPQEISNVIKLQIENYKERAKMLETGKKKYAYAIVELAREISEGK